jgi:hypothetical protein
MYVMFFYDINGVVNWDLGVERHDVKAYQNFFIFHFLAFDPLNKGHRILYERVCIAREGDEFLCDEFFQKISQGSYRVDNWS